MTGTARKILLGLLAGLLTGSATLLTAAGPSPATPAAATAAPAASPARPASETAALEPFIDGAMQAEMNLGKMPGGVIAIVKDGKLLLSKGYGFSDIERRAPIDPETSLFRIASTTKLFTWTAVMQLVEQGKLNLDVDVNTYLKTFKIPATYKQPITLRHLMTHTAGFEEGGIGYGITTDLARAPSIAETLAKHMPARIRPPGEMMAYSNYGAALAGLIVEQVSGIAFDDYIEQRIFAPLGMRHATVREPVPTALARYKVVGYAREDGQYVRKPATYEGGYRPAGSGSVSATDMSRFMLMALGGGSHDGRAILTPAGMRQMLSRNFIYHPHLPAMGLGYYELNIGGERAWSHGGTDPLFNTELYLFPDRRLGIFISFSGGDGNEAAGRLTTALIERLYPKPRPEPKITQTGSLERYAGTYQFTRRNLTRIDKFYSMMAQISVSVSGDRLSVGSGNDMMTFVPIADNLFQEVGGTRQIAFRTDAAGDATYLFFDALTFAPLEHVAFLDRANLWYGLLGSALALFLSVILGLVCRWRLIAKMSRAERRTLWVSTAVAIWGTLSVVVLGFLLVATDLVERLSHISASWRIALAMPIVFLGLTAWLLVALVNAWAGKYWTLRGRLYHTAVALAAIATSLFFYKWNLIGWQFG